jgi:hypothetical protein
VSDEAEKNLIGKFKQECGYQVNGEKRIERETKSEADREVEKGGGGARDRERLAMPHPVVLAWVRVLWCRVLCSVWDCAVHM